MMERGDKYYMAICNKTGMLSIYNPSKNIFMSPMADGPIKFTGSVDGKEMHIEHVTRFGRDFSVVCVPYSLKLLIQELQTMNIQMRLITEDNIEQLENLSFSKNIHKLLHAENIKTKDVVANIRKELQQTLRPTNTPERIMDRDSDKGMVWKLLDSDKDSSPAYVPETPPYMPIGSPPGNKTTNSNGSYGSNGSNGSNGSADSSVPFTFFGNPKYPDTPSMEGTGGTNSLPEYTIGETVFYRGGSKANRPWKIKDTGSGEFITIETDDLDGIEEIGDSIKVVSPIDIFRPSMMPEYQGNPMMQGQPGYPMFQGQLGQLGQLGQQGQYMDSYHNPYPEINVNPVIKIVNGPDNSVDTSTHTGQGTMQGHSMGQGIVMGHGQVPNALIMGGTNTPLHKPTETTSAVSGGSGTIDFDKGPIMIKKV